MQCDTMATECFTKAITDKRVFTNLSIVQVVAIRPMYLKREWTWGGKINSGLGLILNITSITKFIGWGLVATNAQVRDGSAVSAEKKVMA